MSAKRRKLVLEDFNGGSGTVLVPTDSGGTRIGTQIDTSTLSGFTAEGTGAQRRLYSSKVGEIVSVADYGALGDWDGSSGSDNKTAFDNAIAALKARGGGTLLIPESTGGYFIDGVLTLADCNAITIRAQSRGYDLDSQTPSKARIVFNSAAHGILITNAFTLNLENVQIDGNGIADNPVIVDRMILSTWNNVSIMRGSGSGQGLKLYDSTTTADTGVRWCVFTNLNIERCGNGIYCTGDIGVNGVFHNTFINTRIDYAADVGILLESCDNNTFVETFLYRRSGSGTGVRWVKTGGYEPSPHYFYHLQASLGGITFDSGIVNPGAIFGYDMTNGQPFPTVPAGCRVSITTDGLNSVGWMVQRFYAATGIVVQGQTVGYAYQDDNGLGRMVYNSGNGNTFLDKLNSTSRHLEMYVDPDGTGEILALELGADGVHVPTGMRVEFIDTQSSVGAAGGASALPATPTGYIKVTVNGTERVIPYYPTS